MSNWFTDLLGAGAGYYNQDKAAQAALELGERGAQEAARLGTETASMAEFKPFTVRTGLGTATTTPEGGYSLTLDPRQQSIQDTAFGSAYGFMSGIGQDPMSQLLGGRALQAYQGLGPSALTGMGVSGYQNIGQDPMQREILAQARQGFANIGQDPRQQALLAQADTAFGRAMADPSQAQADIYGQIRDTQRPEEERQSLALEERMLAQGRLGLSSSAYGGASPELLAQETARQEAMSRANLSARQQAMQEQQQAYGQGLGLLGQASGLRAQDLAEASGLLGAGYTPEQRELARAGALFGAGMTQEQADLARAGTLQQASYMPRTQDLAMAQGMLGIGYTPQQQMLEALGIGTKTAGLADIGRRTGAELFGQLGQTGLETLMQGAELSQGLEASKRQSLTEALLGRQPSMQEQLLANYLGVDAPEGDSGFMSYLGFGDAPTPQWIKDLNPFD
ncbi:hypothetical protein N9232_00490 [Akkermansiaceae bacterium]|nr:hypothetical protein [Akkermansiaceae bacterium]